MNGAEPLTLQSDRQKRGGFDGTRALWNAFF